MTRIGPRICLNVPCVQIWARKSKWKCPKWPIVFCQSLCYIGGLSVNLNHLKTYGKILYCTIAYEFGMGMLVLKRGAFYLYGLQRWQKYVTMITDEGIFCKWIASLCRIYFATHKLEGENVILQMKCPWMEAVADVPEIEDTEVNVASTEIKLEVSNADMLKSTVIPPNNALMKDPPLEMNMSTKDYINKIMKSNRNWQHHETSILQGHVKLLKNKTVINPVSPTPQATFPIPSTVTRPEEVNEYNNTSDYFEDFSFDSPPWETEEQNNEDSPLSLSEEEIARQVEIYREIVECNRNQGNAENQNDTNAESDQEDGDSSFEEEDDDSPVIVMGKTKHEVSTNQLIEAKSDQEVAMSFLQRLGTASTTPLSADFMDNLGMLLEQKKDTQDAVDSIVLFDSAGKPVTNTDILNEKK